MNPVNATVSIHPFFCHHIITAISVKLVEYDPENLIGISKYGKRKTPLNLETFQF